MRFRSVLSMTAVLSVVSTAVWAQPGSVGFEARLDWLQGDLQLVQQQIYGSGSAADQAFRANILDRLNALEEQMRDLTGDIEEMRHSVDTVQRRVDRLVGDVDLRLRELETANAEAAAPTGDTREPAPEPAREDAGPGEETRDSASGGSSQSSSDGSSLPAGSAVEQYEAAQRLVSAGRYSEAESAMRTFLEDHPDHALASNARYWLGETLYVRDRFQEAATVFLEGYQSAPTGNKAADNLLKLGLSLDRLGSSDDACVAFRRLQREFDEDGPVLRRAAQEIDRLQCS